MQCTAIPEARKATPSQFVICFSEDEVTCVSTDTWSATLCSVTLPLLFDDLPHVVEPVSSRVEGFWGTAHPQLETVP